jgi:glycosidase
MRSTCRGALALLLAAAAACAPPAQGRGADAGGDGDGDGAGFRGAETVAAGGDGGGGAGGGDGDGAGPGGGGDGGGGDGADGDGGGDGADGDGGGGDGADGDGGGAGDGGGGGDSDASGDDGGSGGDGGPAPGSACLAFTCGEVTFAFQAPTGATSVALAGTMNAWQLDQAPALLDGDGDGVFELKTTLLPGSYAYKFVVDGQQWVADPSNPLSADDGFGGKNSVLIVPACEGPLHLTEASVDSAKGTLTASFVVTQAPVALGDLVVTVDDQPAPAGALSWQQPGATLLLALSGLAPGVHDVRVGCGPHQRLLKAPVQVPTDWRDLILYFAMTDRFLNGDPGNDAPHAGLPAATNWHGGDFAGLKQKVEDGYFTALGVGAIWISWPAAQPSAAEPGGRPDAEGCGLDPKKIAYTPTQYSGYHGYWPVATQQVEPRFGSLAELRALVRAAHAKGIRVLLDLTANHVHIEAPWFQQHKDDGWFHLPAEVCAEIGWESKPVSCWFTNYLADFNHNGPARYALLEAAVWWVKETGADGFRVDAVKHVEMGFVEDLRRRVGEEFEATGFPFWLVGETFTGDAGAIKAYVSPTRLHGQFDFSGNYAMLETFAKQWKGLDGLDAAWRGAFATYGEGALMSTFLGNHDIARFLSVASGQLGCGVWDIVSDQAAGWKSPPAAPKEAEPYERLRLAFAWLYAAPGVPLIYYGDEVGMPGGGDPDNRRPMRFGAALSPHEQATLQALQQLGQARAAHPALRRGSWPEPLWKESDLLAFHRVLGDDRVLVLLHRGGTAKSGTLDVSAVGFPEGAALVDAIAGAPFGGSGKVEGGKLSFSLPPRSARFLVVGSK